MPYAFKILDHPRIIKTFLLFIFYVAAAKLGLSLYAVSGFATLIWMPTGIALAALILGGYELWPGIALGAFAVNAITGAPLPAALGIALGNTLEAFIAAYFLKEYLGFSPLLNRLSDILGLIFTALFASAISATIGVASLYFGGVVASHMLAATWSAWWFGDVLGAMVLGSFLIYWLASPRFSRTQVQWIEAAAAFALLIAANVIAFFAPDFLGLASIPTAYVFLPLTWIALRMGPRGMTLAIFITAALALSGTLGGSGILARPEVVQGLFLVQAFVGMITIIFSVFTSAVEERKETGGSLRDHIDKLEYAVAKISSEDQAKNDFIAILAHELRNPMAPAVSSLELIKLKAAEARSREIGTLADTAGSHLATMSKLLDDLLDISRISHKKFKLEKEPLQIQPLVTHAVETVEAFYNSRQHALVVSLPPEPLWVEVDPLRLQQILVNILYNAAKYTPPGGRVELTVLYDADERAARMSVRDSGIGLAPDMLAKVFEPFMQGVQKETKTGSGLGIGLSLTKRLVELHGGHIWAESAGLGRGSKFVVTLPALQRMPKPRTPQTGGGNRFALPFAKKQKRADKSRAILIVDDNKAAAEGLGSLLKHGGHRVTLVHDGEAALESMRSKKYGVVLLDIGMPGMDGYEVARRLRAEHGEATFLLVALTGFGQEDDKRKAQEAGFDFHLTKPVGIADVEAVLTA